VLLEGRAERQRLARRRAQSNSSASHAVAGGNSGESF
jgi:hypothetical protein